MNSVILHNEIALTLVDRNWVFTLGHACTGLEDYGKKDDERCFLAHLKFIKIIYYYKIF